MKKVWIDGCFDLFHYGHANALLSAKSMGDYLIAGIHSSKQIQQHKGLPVLTDKERSTVLAGCRWVDEVVENAPFVTNIRIVEEKGCDVVVHGDDAIVDESGNDCYEEVKQKGMFREFRRTMGISTTEIVGRMLLRQKTSPQMGVCSAKCSSEASRISSFHDCLVKEFALPKRKKEGRIVYVDGTFDLYHAGHVALLRRAKEIGDFLVVGIHSDEEIERVKGRRPILSFKERLLCVLSNRYVDEIVKEAPFFPGSDVVGKYGVTDIAYGKDGPCESVKGVAMHEIETEFSYLSADVIIQRIIGNYYEYEERNKGRNK